MYKGDTVLPEGAAFQTPFALASMFVRKFGGESEYPVVTLFCGSGLEAEAALRSGHAAIAVDRSRLQVGQMWHSVLACNLSRKVMDPVISTPLSTIASP